MCRPASCPANRYRCGRLVAPFATEAPAGLHPFREITGARHHAPATRGDLLFHIRAAQLDLCFALAAQIVTRLADAVTTIDEVQGFK